MRCLHIELVKSKGKWKCTACGQLLTIAESIENTKIFSEAMATANASGRPLDEVFDDILGRREWEEMLAKIPEKRVPSKSPRKAHTMARDK
ncbi:MAG TPA: hypothetical protein VFE96_03385 [Candidatus Bathyarchaeia archaeon]|jgi:hypothetical protein|nr:hypothetical protein [Candidatus Bathyarchaeia archaeon]